MMYAEGLSISPYRTRVKHIDPIIIRTENGRDIEQSPLLIIHDRPNQQVVIGKVIVRFDVLIERENMRQSSGPLVPRDTGDFPAKIRHHSASTTRILYIRT